MELQNVVIVDAARSAFGRGAKGSLVTTRMDEVAAEVIRHLLQRNPSVDPYEVEDMACGNVLGGGELSGMTSNVVARLAGLPPEISHVTLNRQCGSSMQATHQVAQAIMTGSAEIALAVGVERMGRSIPAKTGGDNPVTRLHPQLAALYEEQKRPDPKHQSTFSVPFQRYLLDSPANASMPQTAQNVAEAWNLSREEMDAFSAESHHKAVAAYAAGRYKNQIVPIRIRLPVFDAEGNPDYAKQGAEATFEKDECIRADTTVAKLATLKPLPMIVSYGERPLNITAGNACPTNDGASALLLMTERRAKALGLKPLARIRAMAVAGVKPQLMGVGTIPACQKAMQRAGIGPKQVGLAEINEAFASQSIATVRDLGLDPVVVNVNGGAIAIGHPLGASGVRLLVGLCHEMRRRGDVRYGLASMCIGAGMGIATVVEAVN
ncbi:MAG: thiolase family protein [Candidatus Lambdaproteobacteria bacterium]|nr:thiolase family protein [Candidatus Lambdaproteobacteria bacterium]